MIHVIQCNFFNRYATTRLQQAADEDLLLYLLQLVQALKYENFNDIEVNQLKLKMFWRSTFYINFVL